MQPKTLSDQITSLVQRQTEEEEEEELIQARAVSDQTPDLAIAVASPFPDMQDGGQPLPTSELAFFEPRFGHDFSRVRVHTGPQTAKTAQALNAKAFTVGQDVVFRSSDYNPTTTRGRRLIAHELVHTIQQTKPDNRNTASQVKNATNTPLIQRQQALEERLNICVQPVQIADPKGRKGKFKNPTILPSFAAVQSIWEKCCIDITVEPAITVANSNYRVLDIPQGSDPSSEAQNLFNEAGVGGSCIWLFIPELFERFRIPGENGKRIAGGGKTYDAGAANPKVVVVEGVHSTVVAHEIGHAMGYDQHRPPGTVMQPSSAYDKSVPQALTIGICEVVRQFISAGATGNIDCRFRR